MPSDILKTRKMGRDKQNSSEDALPTIHAHTHIYIHMHIHVVCMSHPILLFQAHSWHLLDSFQQAAWLTGDTIQTTRVKRPGELGALRSNAHANRQQDCVTTQEAPNKVLVCLFPFFFAHIKEEKDRPAAWKNPV